MSLLEESILIRGNQGSKTVHALFDSGASYSCIRRDVAESVGHVEPLADTMEFETAEDGAFIAATSVVVLSFFFPDTNRLFTDEFLVFDELSEPLIVGAKTMQAWKIRLDFDNEKILYDKKMHRLRI